MEQWHPNDSEVAFEFLRIMGTSGNQNCGTMLIIKCKKVPWNLHLVITCYFVCPSHKI